MNWKINYVRSRREKFRDFIEEIKYWCNVEDTVYNQSSLLTVIQFIVSLFGCSVSITTIIMTIVHQNFTFFLIIPILGIFITIPTLLYFVKYTH